MESIVQNLVFGLFVGSIYGIAAVGLSLIFGVLRILNVAHGELLMLGGYVAFWSFIGLGLDPFVALLIVVPVMFALGVALQFVLFDRVVRFDTDTKIKNSLLAGTLYALRNTHYVLPPRLSPLVSRFILPYPPPPNP